MTIQDLLDLQATIFILIIVGFILKRKKLISDQGKSAITDLVINIILPCNIVKSFLITFNRSILISFASILIISIIIQIFCTILGKVLYPNKTSGQKKVLRYGIICSNAGFLGNPIAQGVFGDMGLSLASVFLIPQRIVMWSAGISMFSDSPDKKTLIKKVLTHPCIIAVLLGLILMLVQIQLPSFLLSPLTHLSNCCTPLSMLVIGMILGDIDLRTMIDKDVISYSVLRLILMPLAVWAACLLFQINHLVTGVSVLLAAMPAGATTVILASKYEGDAPFATKIVVMSTLFSIVTTLIWSVVLI